MTATSRTRPAISATGLQKSFGDQVVLDGIDLTVPSPVPRCSPATFSAA